MPYNKVFYRITGNAQAQRFFLIDRESGEIKLKTSLLQDARRSENYRVGVLLADQQQRNYWKAHFILVHWRV